MKSVSRFALAIAAAALTVGASAPGWAADDEPKKEKPKKEKAKKEKAPEPVKLSLSPGFESAYNAVVKPYVAKKDATTAAAAKAAFPTVKAAIVNDDDRYQAGNLAQDIANQLSDRELRKEAMGLLIASTRTPDKEKSTAHYILGAISFDTQDWTTAITNLQKAYEMGFRRNDMEGGLEILVADAYGQLKKFPEALDWLAKSEEGSKVAGAKPLPSNFDAKIARFALNTKDYTYIGPWMQKLLRKNPTQAYWHDSLMQTYTYVDLDSQEVLDLMRLLRTVGAMQYQQNYSAYATDSIAAFFPAEVKVLLEEGFAAGTITKSNATFGTMYTDVVEKLKVDAVNPADLDKDLAAAKSGFDAAATGDIAFSIADYARAKAAYEAALAKGSVIDPKDKKDVGERTVMRLAMAKLKLGDFAGARADFAKVTSPGRKAITDFWLIHLEQQEKKAAAPAA